MTPGTRASFAGVRTPYTRAPSCTVVEQLPKASILASPAVHRLTTGGACGGSLPPILCTTILAPHGQGLLRHTYPSLRRGRNDRGAAQYIEEEGVERKLRWHAEAVRACHR